MTKINKLSDYSGEDNFTSVFLKVNEIIDWINGHDTSGRHIIPSKKEELCRESVISYNDDGTEKDSDYWYMCLKAKPCPVHDKEEEPKPNKWCEIFNCDGSCKTKQSTSLK